MHIYAPPADPSLTALARFHETRDAFEQHLKVFGHGDDAQIEALQAKYEADLETVTKTVPTTAEGFKASIEELCYQAQQGFTNEAVSQWLTCFCDGVWDLVRYARR